MSCLSPCPRPAWAACPLCTEASTPHFSPFKNRMRVGNLGYLPALENRCDSALPSSTFFFNFSVIFIIIIIIFPPALSLVLSLTSCREGGCLSHLCFSCHCVLRGPRATPAGGLRARKLEIMSYVTGEGRKFEPLARVATLVPRAARLSGWRPACVSWHLWCHLTLLGREPCQIRCPGILPGWATWSEQ